jgi:hypothetical protein
METEEAAPSQRDRFMTVDSGISGLVSTLLSMTFGMKMLNIFTSNRYSVKSEDEDDAGGKRRDRNDSDIDDIDFEDVFQDDEEVAAEMEVEDDETKDVKVCLKWHYSPTRFYCSLLPSETNDICIYRLESKKKLRVICPVAMSLLKILTRKTFL